MHTPYKLTALWLPLTMHEVHISSTNPPSVYRPAYHSYLGRTISILLATAPSVMIFSGTQILVAEIMLPIPLFYSTVLFIFCLTGSVFCSSFYGIVLKREAQEYSITLVTI